MKAEIVSLTGEKTGDIELVDAVFGVALDDVRKDLLHRAVRYQLAKRRRGTRKTQERTEVSRTTAKFGRQKGGGRARHGSRKANIFVGGGVAHGPRVRSHAHDLPKKVRRLALAHALSARAAGEAVTVIDAAALDAPKTAAVRKALESFGARKALIVDVAFDANFRLAARNLDDVALLPVDGLNVYDILRRDRLVLTKAAVEAIQTRFAEWGVDAPASVARRAARLAEEAA